MTDSTEPPASGSEKLERKPYEAPTLKSLGDVVSLTQAEYGGLDKAVYGYLFAQSSPTLPDAPVR